MKKLMKTTRRVYYKASKTCSVNWSIETNSKVTTPLIKIAFKLHFWFHLLRSYLCSTWSCHKLKF